MSETRNVRVTTVGELMPGDVVVTWEDDGFPWEGRIVEIDDVPIKNVRTLYYAHGQASYNRDPAAEVKVRADALTFCTELTGACRTLGSCYGHEPARA